MNEAGGSAADGRALTPVTPLEKILFAIVGFLFAFTAFYASVNNLNWDEFFFLSHIHSIARGEAIQPLQTFYVRLFGWLPKTGGDEISQIMLARTLFLLLLGLSMYFLYRISERFFSRASALFAVAISLSVTNVINHGPSFRFDTLTLVLVMFALYALLKRDFGWWLAAALSTALAMLVTVKTVFFLPAILAVALYIAAEEKWSRKFMINAAVAAAVAVAVFAGLFLMHLSLLGQGIAGGAEASGEMLAHSGGKMFGQGVLAPRLPTLLFSLVQNPAQWLVTLAGIGMAGLAIRNPAQRWRAVVVVALALPLFTPLIYRNAFSYFYVLIIPPATLATGYFVEKYRERAEHGGASARLLILAPLLVAIVTSAGFYKGRLQDQRIAQSETVRLVHELFPRPVPYIDRNAMIASFPKVGFFMSSWGVENYRAKNLPVMEDLLREKAPVFLLANTLLLDLDGGGGSEILEERRMLLDEDLETLQDNFIHFWGIVYLAGKKFDFAGGRSQPFEILLPGPYMLEAAGSVTIDGVPIEPGRVVKLGRGAHLMQATAGLAAAVLVYGDNPARPQAVRNPQPIYTGL